MMGLTSEPDPSVPDECRSDLRTINLNENNTELLKKERMNDMYILAMGYY